ncbi:MAG: glycosyltransferase family 2 protein [Akkermansia sp.]|nr:glycosyltransferase family 2 protein [Akkermansia sp.]
MSISKRPNSEACIKVSVIIPVYKAEKYISETIVSLRRQTLKELEFIFIDDKSNDNSFNIIQESAKVDSRIVLIQNNSNIGAGASRNKGIEIARGDFIAFMDLDDLLSPNSAIFSSLASQGIKCPASVAHTERKSFISSNLRRRITYFF